MTTGAQEIATPADAFEFLDAPLAGDVAARSPISLFWRRLRQDRVAMASMAFVVLLLPGRDLRAARSCRSSACPGPYKQNLNLLRPFGEPTGPSASNPMGVDRLGRDVMSRVIYGSRVSLEVGIIGAAFSTSSA